MHETQSWYQSSDNHDCLLSFWIVASPQIDTECRHAGTCHHNKLFATGLIMLVKLSMQLCEDDTGYIFELPP